MDWAGFVKQLEAMGFKGDGNDFATVTSWLKAEGHHTEEVESDDGAVFVLKELFDARPGKRLDVTKAKDAAEFQHQVQEGVRAELDKIQDAVGPLGRRPGKPVNAKEHDISVGKDRLADDPKGGFKHAGEFYKAVQLAGTQGQDVPDDLVAYTKALSTYGSENIGTDGGFAVPPDYRSAITQRIMGEDSILSRCDQIPLDGNSVAFPDDETTPWQTSGGVLAYWGGEAGSMTQSKPQLKLKELKLRKVYCLVPVTEELLQDASAMGSYITRKAGEKLDFKIGEAIFRGTGAGQPLGFLNAQSNISVAKVTNQTATTFTAANAISMYMRLYAPYRQSAVWFINQDVETQLPRFALQGRTDGGTTTTSWGTGGIYIPAGGLASTPYGTILGRPVIPTQHCAQLGTEGDVCLCAMSQYAAAIKSGGVEGSTSIHLWFDQDSVAFKFRMRVDGQPWLSSTISPRAGSNTMSAFVSLAVRS